MSEKKLPPYGEMKELFGQAGLALEEPVYQGFCQYWAILMETNQVMNLTRITEPREAAEKHFLDSILPLADLGILEKQETQSLSVLDVGTGAGFPGIPWKLYCPKLRITLMDSLKKRVGFLEEVCRQLELEVSCIHARAEEAGQREEYREQFDLAVARAVAALPILSEYCLPFVKPGGIFAAMKGPGEKAEEAYHAISLLGGEISHVEPYPLPSGDQRTLIQVKKISRTPSKYPRNSAQIAKKSL